jgi:GNAT superfamily N-acetyltransferase
MQASRLSPLGVRTLYCISLHVDPAHQARGVGGALVRWATDKADADGDKVWVHAAEAAYPLFAKHEFEVIETLPHELDKYATKPTLTGAPWGTYVIRYMVREPRSRA